MNLFGRVVKTIGEVGATASKHAPGVTEKLIRPAGSLVGKTIGGIGKGSVKALGGAVKGVNRAIESGAGKRAGKAAANTIGTAAAEMRNVGSGINKAAKVLEGKELPKVNKVLHDVTGKNFNGKKWGAMVKKSDDAVIFGHKATALGSSVIVAGGLAAGAVGAVKEFNDSRVGRNTGSTTNAPTNTYATMGNSYANNAGATGDLVLALNDQRKTGIL